MRCLLLNDYCVWPIYGLKTIIIRCWHGGTEILPQSYFYCTNRSKVNHETKSNRYQYGSITGNTDAGNGYGAREQ